MSSYWKDDQSVFSMDISKIPYNTSGLKKFIPLDVTYSNSFRCHLLSTIASLSFEFDEDSLFLSYIKIYSKFLACELMSIFETHYWYRNLVGMKAIFPTHFQKSQFFNSPSSSLKIGSGKGVVYNRDSFVKFRMKKAIRNLQYNSIKNSFGEKIATINANKLTILNAKIRGVFLDYHQEASYLEKYAGNKTLLEDSDKALWICGIIDLFSSYEITDRKTTNLVRTYLNDTFRDFDIIFTNLLSVSLPRELWTASSGSSKGIRAISESILRRGGEIVSHDHGGGSAHTEQTGFHFTELFLCSKFVTYTQYQVEEKKKQLNSNYFLNSASAKIVSVQADTKKQRVVKNIKSRISTVLYVPTAFHGEGVRLRPILYDWTYLDWQIRLINFLVSEGLRVFVKPHPEGRSKPPSHFAESLGAQTLSRKFEKISDSFDAYVIDFICSSTTQIILKTGKPVFFLDPGFPSLSENGRSLLLKRVEYLGLYFDDFQRVQVDFSYFSHLLKKEEFEFEYDFVDSFYSCPR